MFLDDPTSPLGVFARQDLAVGERALEIPHTVYMSLTKNVEKEYSGENDEWFWNNMCNLSKKVAKENKKGKRSRFPPYVAYLKSQGRGQIPATWSKLGKEKLRAVVTPGSDVVDWMDLYFHGTACDPSILKNDPDGTSALALVIQRGFDNSLIPIWDMVNHHNGRINTENDSIFQGDKLNVRISKNVNAGSEIFASYDMCTDCRDVQDYWGTPEILRDFGFVEDYPQRWVYGDDIWFVVDWKDEEELEVYWDEEEENNGLPNEKGMEFLRKEFQRLERVGASELVDGPGAIPQHEWDTIVKFHEASLEAVWLAIDSVDARKSQVTSTE